MLAWLKSLFRKSEPQVAMTPHPVQFNPSNAAQVARNRARIARLEAAIAAAKAGPYRDNLKAELERRKAALTAAGMKE